MKPRALLLGGMVAAVVAPATAGAATKQVYMGTPPSAQKAVQKLNADINDFFPHGITIHAGDSIRFLPVGFHDIDFPAKGGGIVALIAPQNTKPTGVSDAAGSPFWFNDTVPNVGFNPSLVTTQLYGKSASYNGTKAVVSGLPLADKPKPVLVKFTKTGSYTYFCDIHPGMKGTVHVVAKSAKAPSAKSDAAVVKRQLATAMKTIRRVNAFKPGADTIQIGGSGTGGVESYNFFPSSPTVKVGTTVTFQMPVGTTETHTATTGPGNPEDASTYLGGIAASFNGQPTIDARGVYASDAPGGTPASLTPTLHGNGFWNSGALDREKNSPLPPSNQVTFGAAGQYTFYCLIHPFMKVTVNVTS